jgi:hypothetical protein
MSAVRGVGGSSISIYLERESREMDGRWTEKGREVDTRQSAYSPTEKMGSSVLTIQRGYVHPIRRGGREGVR